MQTCFSFLSCVLPCCYDSKLGKKTDFNKTGTGLIKMYVQDARTKLIVAEAWDSWDSVGVSTGEAPRRWETYDIIKHVFIRALHLPPTAKANMKCAIGNKWKECHDRLRDDPDIQDGVIITVWTWKSARN